MDDPAPGKPDTPNTEAIENDGISSKDMGKETEAPRKPSRIRYTASCFNKDGPDFDHSQDEPFPSQVPRHVETTKPIIEIVTNMAVMRNSDLKQSNENNDEKGKDKKETMDDKVIRSIGSSRIIIHSPHLSELIRDTVDYYPGQNLTGETITIHEPYGVLMHHWETLSRTHVSGEDSPESSSPESNTNDRQTKVEHLSVLVEYLTPIVKSQLEPIQRRLGQETPTTTWEDLWYLLRPGSQSYCKWKGQWMGCIIEETRKALSDEDDDNLTERWKVRIWFLSMQWSYGTLIPVSHTIEIPKFEGEKKVGQLDIYPEGYFKGERKKDFEARGDQICDMLWKGHIYANYDGELMSEKKMKYKGQIIVSAFGDQEPDFDDNSWGFETIPEPIDQARPANDASGVLQPLWLDPTKDSRDSLTAGHKSIICPVVAGFTLPAKTWVSAHVGNIRDLAKEEVPEAIVSGEKLKIIKALAERQMSAKPWSADYIKNKGEGVVILLHGPPGVGKTYTVESIAMRKRQPLISLTISDLRTQATSLEEELTRWFKMADKWRAILLIDECDIFLERREKKDIERNAVVSAFLRKIEYFGGLLFLTTNRVGHIDDAFMSRVHAVIGFDPLDGPRREKIWDSLLAKLNRDRRGEIRISNGAKKFLKTPEVLEYTDWNGREIRNAFQTAIALAEYEAKDASDYDPAQEVIVEAEQFKDVMEMNKSFRSYLDSIRSWSASERAQRAAWRNDAWDQQQREN
ncbi:Protein MSP1 [Colletotrichum siamense]|uniref:Protein MSP1 n=1 Tax=Colletotrichum siamense TaxID=690259 RepID=A0A9P5K8H7_COLSI|nr:Protein MSP1 [Colletotrichum siamense]KAF4863431.1 Protein MSP1 [Colletotrichum siamense]